MNLFIIKMNRILRDIDIFSMEPSALKFGDSNDPKTKSLWKTSFGGIISLAFFTVLILYVVSASVALNRGDNDWNEDTTQDTKLYKNAVLNFDQMKAMPVVTINIDTPHLYLDSSSVAFEKNIFVALLNDKRDENGNKIAEFERFVPCKSVNNDQ